MSMTDTTMEDPQADDSSHILVNNPHAHNASHIFLNRKHDDELKGAASGAVWSDPYSGGILDVLFSSPTFLQSMSARAFANYKCVCKSWARWYHANTHTIANARRHDESSDWYFPLFGKLEGHTELAWSGIWHSDASHMELSPLPSLGYLQSIPGLGSHLEHEILATAGGLLLTTNRRSLRREVPFQRAEARPSLRLVVSNPLTKQVRVLPFFHTLSPPWDGFPMYIHMLVDDKANTYKVIVWYSWGRQCSAIQVYDSTSISWKLVLGEQPWMRPMFGAGQRCNGCFRGTYYTSAYMHGRLYFADIRAGTEMEVQNDPLLHGVLRLFEADIRDGQWKSTAEFSLRRSRDTRVKMVGLLIDDIVITMHNMELVECKGRIFAVIPSTLDQVVHPWGPVPPGYGECASSKYLPVQFYVLQLDGSVGDDGYLAHGVVRIEIPNAMKGCRYVPRRRSLFGTMYNCKRVDNLGLGWDECTGQMCKNWFTCIAKGSEIWITCRDYLVEYNTMSREFKTHILPPNSSDVKQWNFDYKPSIHLTP